MCKPLLGLFGLVLLSLLSCHPRAGKNGLHFTEMAASSTGIHFNNTITENDSLNMFVNEYTYMGGGVGIADFNHDGLPDVFFAGNQVSSQLYINKGNLQFDNLTETAGLSTDAWCTGVSITDINNDGWADIYICVSGKVPGLRRKNLLYINQHDLTFKEEAASYGLADSAYATQAVFFDYDGDGRQDMYLLNHTLDDNRPNDIIVRRIDSNAIAADKLYHNEGIPSGSNHPVFKDQSVPAGIVEDGNGLGIVVSDFNGDGWPDIYVANDYIRNDLLWLNDKNGHFSNCIASALKHQAYSSMGVDAADINNDGLPDIINLDMQPETSERKKMMYSFLSDQRHQLEVEKGYEPEYIHNMLQLNNGTRLVKDKHEPFFSEVAQMAGISETDWSWSVLIADLDNDGWKDIHITNGMGRDPTNIDFLEYRRKTVLQSGVPENNMEQRRELVSHLTSLGSVSLHNYLYQNNGNKGFNDVSSKAGFSTASISNGAVYVDLDNDGDLDIVTSNINSEAFVMRNDSRSVSDTAGSNNFLTLILQGDSMNKDGIGAKVYTYCKGMTQVSEQFPVKGYLSSVDQRLHIGVGNGTVDSLRIVWPDKKTQLLLHPAINTMLTLHHAQATGIFAPVPAAVKPLLEDVTAGSTIAFKHAETFFYDYSFQPLLPQKYSQEGPFISTGDVNGDGREDFFIGGAFKQSGEIFVQQVNGSFKPHSLVKGVKNEEDMQSIFFDADGDKDPDLLVVSGSTEFDINSSFYRPRLYLNDGHGNFMQDSTAFSPLIRTPGKSVAVADFDKDGDIDIFIGGRVSLGTYPLPARSYLLRNDHGKFIDVTRDICPDLETPGLLNAAAWADIDGDKIPELIIAGDWMPIRIFKMDGSKMKEMQAIPGLSQSPGFWRSLAVVDIDNDGDADIVAGNLGLNNPFHIDKERPAELYAKDYDGNGIVEPIFCYYIKNNEEQYKLSAGISRDEWAAQMPSIKKRYNRNELYAKASMEEVFSKDITDGAVKLEGSEVRSGWWKNQGLKGFLFHPFAIEAQVAPVNAIAYADINHDGQKDLLLAGNEYQSQVMAGRYDASYGLLMAGNGKGSFLPVPASRSGLIIDGDTRDLKIINAGGRQSVLAAVNNDSLRVFALTPSK